jgi:hypothetical protein
MARGKARHPIEIPDYLWEALDKTAEAKNISTAQLIATWLTNAAHLHAGDELLPAAIQERLLALPRVDGRYTYPRREPRSALAAQIVAEGSPSPTLGELQRKALSNGNK